MNNINNDLISRQQAIDAVKKNTFRLKFVEEQNYESSVAWSTKAVYSDLMEEALLDLPTIQLDTTSADYISRQAALNLFPDDNLYWDTNEGYFAPHYAKTLLRNLPSVQPERPKGRWIPTVSGKGRHECSRCHEYAPCYQDGSEHLSTFCVLCGAKMEEGK